MSSRVGESEGLKLQGEVRKEVIDMIRGLLVFIGSLFYFLCIKKKW